MVSLSVTAHFVSRRKMIDMVFDSEHLQHFYVKESGSNAWNMGFYLNPPSGWVKVKDNPKYSRDILTNQLHLIGVLSPEAKRYPTDSHQRWRDINLLWSRGMGIIEYAPLRNEYLRAMFDTMLDQGVQYVESKRPLGARLYVLDAHANYTSTGGRRIIDEEGGEYEIKETIKFLKEYSANHTEFIGMKNTIYTSRRRASVSEDMERAISFHQKYPDLVVAFDLVGEEDAGNSFLYHMDSLIKLYDNKTEKSRIPLNSHVAETNWAGDIKSSRNELDPVGSLENTLDALLLGVHRVGHGIGYIKHPYYMKLLRERDIALEICPISNQILGFYPDHRAHPAINYIRSGNPVVLGSDDPGTFGNDLFTTDWYNAFMAWGLDLSDMKLLATNSLKYSSMTESQKTDAMERKWLPLWNRYIEDIKKEACARNFTSTPSFANIHPKFGARQSKTLVNIYGNNFERGICKKIQCKFGDHVTDGWYLSNQLVQCVSHDRGNDRSTETVDVSVSFDGQKFYSTGSSFTYQFPKYEITTERTPINPTTVNSKASNISEISMLLMLVPLYQILTCLHY